MMQYKRGLLIAALLWLAPLPIMGQEPSGQAPDEFRLFDDFDGRLALDWKIVRPDETHYSLTANKGKLTITTQAGTIHKTGRTPVAKNLFFVDLPDGADDFVVTTCLEGFWPDDRYQQAGLIIHNDDDNYLKVGCEYSQGKPPILNVLRETGGLSTIFKHRAPMSPDRFWLRVTRRGEVYDVAVSNNGDDFTSYGCIPWADIQPTRVGILAKNGGWTGSREQDARFDIFELRSLTDEETKDPNLADWQALQGRWKVESSRLSGKKLGAGMTEVVIGPERIALTEGSSVLTRPYMLDARKTPKLLQVGSEDHTSLHFLFYSYALDGDKLTLCVKPELDAKAPDALETSEGDGRLLLVCRRIEEEQLEE